MPNKSMPFIQRHQLANWITENKKRLADSSLSTERAAKLAGKELGFRITQTMVRNLIEMDTSFRWRAPYQKRDIPRTLHEGRSTMVGAPDSEIMLQLIAELTDKINQIAQKLPA